MTTLLTRTFRPAPRHRSTTAAPELDFARILGPAAWRRLAPSVRERFSAKPKPGKPIRYHGTMHAVGCSRAGWLIAQACRLIGTPFALHRGTDIPCTITLRAAQSGAAIVWEREYRYPDHPTALVRSEKRSAADGTLTESVGAGFAMKLALSEADGALHFRSLGYVWQIGAWRLPLPGFLSPGAAHVVHQDLGAGRFRFVMTIHHTLLGTLFHQDGVFQEEETAP
jgi:hypothetical protein